MKVLYSHQTFTNQIYDDISRYIFELIKHFRNENEIECELSVKYSNNFIFKRDGQFAFYFGNYCTVREMYQKIVY